MEKYKTLYKDNSQILSPRQHKIVNREFQLALRNRQRKKRLQDTRNVSLSPSPQKTKVIIKVCPESEEKENTLNNASQSKTDIVVQICPEIKEYEDKNNTTQQEEEGKVIHIAKAVCNTTNPVKLSKQEAFLKRFIEWKKNKKIKQQQQENANKKRPFIPVVSGSQSAASTVSSIIPKGHHKEFRPPVGLKMPKVDPQKSALRGRESIYTLVPTPPRKNIGADEKPLNKFPIGGKALPRNLHTKVINSSKTPNAACKIEPISTTKATGVSKTLTVGTKTSLRKSPLKSSTTKTAVHNMIKTSDRIKLSQPPSRENLKPSALKMPPPPPSLKSANNRKQEKKAENAANDPSTTSAGKQSGAAGKVRNVSSKRTENIKQTKKSPLKSGRARLAQNLKAKKLANCSKKLSSAPITQVDSKKLLTLFNNNNELEDMVIQTPKDFATLNPFGEFVTSTKLKTSCHNLEEVKGTSPTEDNRPHSNSSAKRNILQEVKNSPEEEVNGLKKPPKKYNFIISNTEKTNIVSGENAIKTTEELKIQKDETNAPFNSHESTFYENTPPKCGPEERPSNYLSPFVSVARGKVSLKKETEKRNSIYMQNGLSTDTLNPSDTSKCSVEDRRTLEAVRYFRQQLQAEIDRLHKSCDIWEMYKEENLEKIQNANGEDMINVTIGQTRLLTSKKFMQFKGLIDRCESGVTGIGAVDYDGSEDTKPITSLDLEGFWSMLKLQVDNLDKRFETLNRWKSNDWVDPDEVKPKIKKILSKVKKAKSTTVSATVKPNSGLQQIIRRMHAEMRKNKKNVGDTSPNVILLPQKQRRSGISNSPTPGKSIDNSFKSRRRTITVKDRKYFSPTATVISVPNRSRRSSLQRTTSEESPKLLPHVKKFKEALNTMESSLDLRKPILTNDTPYVKPHAVNTENYITEYSSPLASGRKSILKTPGTARSRMRNVIFNEKLRVKKFNFLKTEDGDASHIADGENNESTEEDLTKNCNDKSETGYGSERTITLRNRNVRLRPSCEIVIPT